MVYPGGFTLKSRVALFTKKAPVSTMLPEDVQSNNGVKEELLHTSDENTLTPQKDITILKNEANNNDSIHDMSNFVHSTPIKLNGEEDPIIKNKVQWSTEQVEALLDSVNDHLEDFRGRMVHTRVWRRIGQCLADQFPHLTPQNCYNKWKNLRRDVRLALSNPNRALKNPGILRRAAMLAALVYPSGPEADPAFLQQLDVIQSSMGSHESKINRGRATAINKTVQQIVLENKQSGELFGTRDMKPETSEDDQDSCPPTNGGRFSPSPTTSDAAAPTDLRKQNDIITALTASFMRHNHASQNSAVFPPQGGDMNPFILNPSLLLNSSYFLQNVASSSDTSSVHSNPTGYQLSSASDHEMHRPSSSINDPVHQQHVVPIIPPLACVGMNDHQLNTGPSPNKQRCTTPVAAPVIVPDADCCPQPNVAPKLSFESLRELVQNFRDGESNRIATIDTLVSVIGELQSDSRRRLDALNRLVELTQCHEQFEL